MCHNHYNKTRQGYAFEYPQTDGLLLCKSRNFMQYNKPFKSIQEQIQLLRNRGLIIDEDADHYLRHLNYYRLSGYWAPFQKSHSDHLFNANTHFDDVLNIYIFDRELRLILLDAIERLEVSLRTHWAYHCAEVYGAHAYFNKEISRKSFWYEKNFSLLQQEVNRSDELFIKHYRQKYSSSESPPIWVVCEVMSLGLLSRWLKDLKPAKICNKIAKNYQVDHTVLISFIEHLTYIRNLCAHHSRVWNRKLTKTIKIPRSKPPELISSFNQDPVVMRKIYNSLVMLMHFLTIVSPGHHFKNRLLELIERHSIDVRAMGFPADWMKRNVWKS